VSTDPTFALSMAAGAAALLIFVFHLADVNEKEPAWAIGLMLLLGAATGVVSANVAEGEFRREFLGAPVSAEAATLAAIALGLVAFRAIQGGRSWSELNGLIDGVMYGAAAGLGVALGSILVDELDGSALAARLANQPDPGTVVWESMRETLYQGLFGAITGAGIGAAVEAGGRARRVFLVVAGAATALAVQYLSELIREDATSAPVSVGQWIALSVPAWVVVAILVVGLGRERAALNELRSEVGTGVVTEEEYSALTDPRERRKQYLALFGAGNLEHWEALRSLHNREVQLAMAKCRRPVDDEEVGALRESIGGLRKKLESTPAPPARRV
jgi:hypothetical protein